MPMTQLPLFWCQTTSHESAHYRLGLSFAVDDMALANQGLLALPLCSRNLLSHLSAENLPSPQEIAPHHTRSGCRIHLSPDIRAPSQLAPTPSLVSSPIRPVPSR